GCGMSREVLDKCFEPFFTTKELGKGTGLGLPTSVGIVRSHEGFIEVDSEPGRGSHFYVFLPSTVLESTVKQSEPGAIQKWKGNGELILLVDDEQNIRNIVATTLGRSGYKVIEAADGAEGISLFHQNSDRIRAVVTDIMMPVMDGIALVRTLRQTHQNLPVIAATGLNTDNIEANLHALGVRHIISKPYSREELLQTLHEVLHTGAD
ncbi:MAG TPA: response regulator, partial [Roseimicrobium sp.]|nr:response regulator [Roseimicrobium sp.]